jgi:hypothetical protein
MRPRRDEHASSVDVELPSTGERADLATGRGGYVLFGVDRDEWSITGTLRSGEDFFATLIHESSRWRLSIRVPALDTTSGNSWRMLLGAAL